MRKAVSLLATAVSATSAGAFGAGAVHAASAGPQITFNLQGADATGDVTVIEPYQPNVVYGDFFWAGNFSVGTTATLTKVTTDCGLGSGPQPVPVSGSPMIGVSATMNCRLPQGTHTLTISATDNAGNTTTVSHKYTWTVAAPPPPPPVNRFEGNSRYGTGVAVSQAAFPNPGSATAVVLARGDVFSDALAGIPLAKAKNGPLLLTPGGAGVTALDRGVEAELVRVLPRDKNHIVYILGGTGAIPQSVEDYIANILGYATVRLSGASRFDTAVAIAGDPRALNSPQNTVVARGDDFADALASGPFASNPYKDANGAPAAIVLTDGTGAAANVPTATAAYLAGKLAAGQKVLAVGGGAAKALGTLPGSAGKFDQIVGTDRYDTAARVEDRGWPGISQRVPLGIVAGTSFPDALTGGAYMALKNGPLRLHDTCTSCGPNDDLMQMTLGAKSWMVEADLFGGPKVLDSQVVIDLLESLQEDMATSYFDHRVLF